MKDGWGWVFCTYSMCIWCDGIGEQKKIECELLGFSYIDNSIGSNRKQKCIDKTMTCSYDDELNWLNIDSFHFESNFKCGHLWFGWTFMVKPTWFDCNHSRNAGSTWSFVACFNYKLHFSNSFETRATLSTVADSINTIVLKFCLIKSLR